MKVALSRTNNTFPEAFNENDVCTLGEIPSGKNYVLISNLDDCYTISITTFNEPLQKSSIIKIKNQEPVRLQEGDSHYHLEIDPSSISDSNATVYFDLDFLQL